MRVIFGWFLAAALAVLAPPRSEAQPAAEPSTPVHILGVVVGADGEARVYCRRHHADPSTLRDAAAVNAAARRIFPDAPDVPTLRWEVNDVFISGGRPLGKGAQAATFQVDYSGFSEEARTAFQYAVDLWAARIESDVPIEIDASWSSLEEDVLGSAGPQYLDDADTGDTWFASALANAIRGRDDFPDRVDIVANFNNDFDNWYFGLDGETPPGMIDFVTVVLHEIGHGLGFLGSMKVDDGDAEEECNGTLDVGCWGFEEYPEIPIVYDRFAEDASGDRLINQSVYPKPSSALGDVLEGGPILFAGETAVAIYGARPPLYAPAEWLPGSSYAHLDEVRFDPSDPSALMSPSVSTAEAIHDPGPVGCAIFRDIGWQTTSACGNLPAPPAPDVPQLTAPADGSQNLVPPVIFDWEPASGASTYSLQISTDAGFGTNVTTYTAGGTQYAVDSLGSDQTHYWRVRSSNGQTASEYSEPFQFDTAPLPPAAPELASPGYGEAHVAVDLTLTWEPLASAESYQVQVAETAEFAEPVVDEVTSATSLDVTGLERETQYFWRVRGRNAGGDGGWSEAFVFTTIITIPSPPEPLLPMDFAGGVDTTLTLEWSDVDEADSYQVQVSPDSTFEITLIDTSDVLTTVLEIDGLVRDSTYFWRVRSENEGEVGGWSPVFTFMTLVHAPLVPTPLKPTAGSDGIEIPVLFSWTQATGADYYQLQVAQGSVFDDPIVNLALVDSTRITIDGLEHSTPYVWRVRAVNAAGRSVWTTGIEFTTTTGVSREDEESLPQEFRIDGAYPNPFEDQISVEVAMPESGHLRLSVFDLRGREVDVVVDERRRAGRHTIRWSAPLLPSGMYLLKLEAVGRTAVVKATLVRGRR